jgi:hypothetical protein
VSRPIGLVFATLQVGLLGCGLNAAGLDAADAGPQQPDAAHRHSDGAAGHPMTDAHVGQDTRSSSSSDAGHADTGHVDAGQVDAGNGDARGVDAGHLDAGHLDAGHHDSGHDAHVAADTGVDAGILYATTCAELSLADGKHTTTLYLGGDPAKPWTATCVTSGGTSKTYLPLPAGNMSSYPVGGCGTATSGNAGVVTTWAMVLFDPTTMMVTTNDLTGANSTGSTSETSGNGSFTHQYDVMYFASGRSCVTTTATVATVNLSGTSFVVDPSQTFPVQGYESSGSASTSGTTTTLKVQGFPGEISACNDYYSDVGGACLKLAYAP